MDTIFGPHAKSGMAWYTHNIAAAVIAELAMVILGLNFPTHPVLASLAAFVIVAGCLYGALASWRAYKAREQALLQGGIKGPLTEGACTYTLMPVVYAIGWLACAVLSLFTFTVALILA